VGLLQLLQRGVNDVVHPFGMGSPRPVAAPQPAPAQIRQPMQPQQIHTPAPVQAPRPIISTPGPGQQVKNFNIGAAPKVPQQPQANIAQRVINQINPFDNGRTFKQTAPTNQGSVMHQATHNGATNVAGNAVNKVSQLSETNWNPTHLVEKYAVQPALELGVGAGHQIYNRGIAPVFNLPHETLGSAFANSSNPNLRANANYVSHLSAGHQAANALQLASNAIPGGGEVVDNLAASGGAKIAAKTAPIVGKIAAKGIQYGGKGILGAATGAGINTGSALAQGANAKQVLQAAKQGAEFGGIAGTALPIAADAAPHVVNGVRVAAPVIKAGAQNVSNAVKDATAHPLTTPQIRTNLADQKALRAYSTYLTTGKPDVVKGINRTITDGQAVLAKHGVANTRNLTVADAVDHANGILDTLGKQRNAVAQGGYLNLGGGDDRIQPTNQRPDGELQKAIEAAHNAGNTELEKKLTGQLSDQAMNPNATMSADRRAALMAKMQQPSLPKELSGAKPGYAIGGSQYALKFPDDVTKSLYIVGGKGQSASHGGYMDFLHQALPNKSDAELTAMGNQLRTTIKAQAQQSPGGDLSVAPHPELSTATHNPQTGQVQQPTVKLPNNALKQRSKPGSAMTPIQEALQAKQAKLQAGVASDESPAPTLPGQKPSAVAAPGKKLSRFANVTVQNSDKVEPSVKKLVDEKAVDYTPQSTKAGQDAAQAFVKGSGSVDKATTKVLSNLHTSEPGKITRQDVFNAQAVADRLQKTGKAEDAGTAAEIYGTLSAHHTAAGQQIQAAAALAKQSPQGLHQLAIKAITNGGKNGAVQKISDGVAKQVSDKVDEIAQAEKNAQSIRGQADKATDPATKETLNKQADTAETAHDDRIQELQKIINQNVHHSTGSKLFTLWRTGLLTGPQTMTKVALSHAIMAGAEKVKDVPAVAIDKGISGVSRVLGKGPMRSTALTMRGEGTGFSKGSAAAMKLMRTGLDTKGTGGFGDTLVGKLAHPEVDFGNSKLGKAANFYVQKTGGIHASIPKGFFTAAQANDLYKQAMAEGVNKGLKGADLQTHVDNYVAGASDFAKQEAQLSAQRASFQQDTTLGHVGRALQQVPGGKWMLPFAKIASTILNDAVDYSPGGAIKAGWQAFKEAKGADGWTPTVQKHFVEELGRAITGTGAIAAGVALYKHGVMTLGYPTSKPEQAIWKAQGKTPNSILINGKWRDTSSLGPFGTLLFMGGSVAQSGEHDAKGRSQVGAAATGAIQNVTSQSYLSGLTSAANALSQPQEFAGSEAKQLAGSVVPIAVATTARATDAKQRNAPGVVQSIESKIPGARETLSPQQDMFGRQLNREGGVATNLLDPSRPSGEDAGKQVNELDRLEKTTGQSAVPQPVKSINGTDANGKTVATGLTQAQQDAYNSAVGPKIQAAYKSIMSNPNYNQLTDASKVSALQAAKDDISTIQKAQTLKGINGNTVKLTNAQQAGQTPDYVQSKLNEQSGGTAGTAVNGKLDGTSKSFLNSYNGMTATERTKAAASQNDFDYKYALAQYNNNTLNGTLTKAGQITAKEALAKAQVGSAYSQDIRQFYGLNKPEIQSLISTDPNGKQIASQLQSYDQALYNAGITTSRKFKNGFGSGSSGGGSSSVSLPTAINYKSSVPKTGLGKFSVGSTKGVGSSKAKLVGYSTSNPSKAGVPHATVGKLPSAPKFGNRVALAKPAAVFKPPVPKTKKFKGAVV